MSKLALKVCRARNKHAHIFKCVAFPNSTMLICDFPELTYLQTELLTTPADSHWKKQLLLESMTKTIEEWTGQE